MLKLKRKQENTTREQRTKQTKSKQTNEASMLEK